MTAIVGAAYLHICERCGGHGSIRCPDGSETDSFVSKEAAYEACEELFKRGAIDVHERTYITHQIARSSLPTAEPIELAVYQKEVFERHADNDSHTDSKSRLH